MRRYGAILISVLLLIDGALAGDRYIGEMTRASDINSGSATSGQALVANGAGGASFSSTVVGDLSGNISYTSVTTSQALAVNTSYSLDNSDSLAIAPTMPSGASAGNWIRIRMNCAAGKRAFINFSTNSQKLNGIAVFMANLASGQTVVLTYVDSTLGWVADQNTIGSLPTANLMSAWLNGRYGLTLSGGFVIQWDAYDGTTSYSYTASGSARPTTSTTGMNGFEAVSFDGVANVLAKANSSHENLTAGSSAFAVIQFASLSARNANARLIQRNAAATGYSWAISSISAGEQTWGENAASRTNNGTTGTLAINTPQVLEVHRSSTASWTRLAVNGMVTSTQGYAAAGSPTVSTGIGGTASGSTFYTGLLGMMVIYSDELNLVQANTVRTFCFNAFDLGRSL